MKKILCLALLGLFAQPGAAADDEPVRYYDVELVIFENLDRKSHQSEQWPTSVEQELPESEVVVELNRPYPGKLPDGFDPAMTFKRLPQSKYRLNAEVEKIEESRSRRILLHTAWRQPGISWEDAVNVHLTRQIPASSEEQTNTDGETATQNDLAGEAGELEAYIKVILSRYLHVDADIVLRTQPKTDRFDFYLSESEEPRVYRLDQLRRRIRSTELHYLDHPVLGMLVIMHPVETEKL